MSRCQRIQTLLGVLVVEVCYICKVPFAMSEETFNTLQKAGPSITFYCPFGHSQVYSQGETEADKLRRELQRKVQNEAYLETRIKAKDEKIESLQKSNAATRGLVTRVKNRIANGVCPCCNRTFSNLHNHMKSQHPDYRKTEAA